MARTKMSDKLRVHKLYLISLILGLKINKLINLEINLDIHSKVFL